MFRKSAQADGDVAYGPLFAAMRCMAEYVANHPAPQLYSTALGFKVGDYSEENREFREAAARLPGLVEKARKARVLGEYSAKEFDDVIGGLSGLLKRDFESASRGLDKAMIVPEMRWIEEELLLARSRKRPGPRWKKS